MMKMVRNLRFVAPAVGVMFLAFILVLSAACRGGDQIAPDKSTITLAANPATVVLVGGSGSADVVATVSSAVGVPLKDQDVRFSSSAGSLFTTSGAPGANVPIRTDDLGNAHVTLVTTTTTTITARSGMATGTLTLSTVPGNLNAIQVNQDTQTTGCLSAPSFTTCGQTLCVVAKAVEADGVTGISGVQLVFTLQNNKNATGKAFTGVFSPTQFATDVNGEVHSELNLDLNSCADVCGGDQGCAGDIIVTLQGGGFPSSPLHFTTSIH